MTGDDSKNLHKTQSLEDTKNLVSRDSVFELLEDLPAKQGINYSFRKIVF